MQRSNHTILKIVALAMFALSFAFSVTPMIGIALNIWGYPETSETILLAFFRVLAWTGGVS